MLRQSPDLRIFFLCLCRPEYFTGMVSTKSLKKTTISGKRSALSNLWKEYGQGAAYSRVIESYLGRAGDGMFRGVVRINAERVRNGEEEVREGAE